MKDIQWRIPPWTLTHLARIPRDRPVALLLRHSVRDRLPPGDAGNELPITDIGRRLARELGGVLGERLRTLHTSPLVRCVQTAEALHEGAAAKCAIATDRLLGDPGVYVIDGDRAWSNWERLGHEGVMRHLVADSEPLPGMARPDEAARSLVHHMLEIAAELEGIHVFVTHDSLVTATAARLLAEPLGPGEFPSYLEGAYFYRLNSAVCTAYRHHEARRSEPLLHIGAW